MEQTVSDQQAPKGAPAATASKWLSATSTVLWMWAAVTLAMAVAITYPVVAFGRGMPPALLAFFAMAVLTGVSAFGVRRQKRPFNVVAVVSAVLWIMLLAAERPRIMWLGMFLNGLSVATVVLNWKRFR